MSVAFELIAESRQGVGKGASRRLRRAGRVPAVLYGGNKAPESLSFDHNEIVKQLQHEGFYSHILSITVGSRKESAILKDLQRHPYKPAILHLDLQRVSADEKIRVHVPLHFINEQTAKGVKQEGGVVSHLLIDVEVACLPKDLPEFIEVDLSELGLGESIHLSELKLPEGVEVVALSHGAEYDVPVVNIHHARRAAEEAGEGEAGAAAPSAPTE